MSQPSSFLRAWNRHIAAHGWLSQAEPTDRGIVLGAETVLLNAAGETNERSRHDRLVALLAAAYRGRFSLAAPVQIEKALVTWQRGERSIASFHLTFALPSPLDADDAYRLFLADLALDAGIAPCVLLEDLGYVSLAEGLRKFDPTQPRVPAGSGSNSGQWASSSTVGERSRASSATSRLAAASGIDAVSEARYERDLIVCRQVQMRSCYAQAMERYAA